MLEATRTRLSFTGEWLIAAVFLAATLVVCVLVVRELRVAPQAFDSAAGSPAPVATVPPDAVSVPTLTLGEGNEIRVGDRTADALARLDPAVKLVSRSVERGPVGPREIRSYQLAGTSFLLVFEPFERQGEPRVAAIYLR